MKNQKVFVYYNLHKKCWSIKALSGDSKGRVIMHTDEVCLKNVQFKVSAAGRARVLLEKRKNVHAGVVGYICKPTEIITKEGVEYTYNPYKFDSFVEKRLDSYKEIENMPEAVVMKDRRVFKAELKQ